MEESFWRPRSDEQSCDFEVHVTKIDTMTMTPWFALVLLPLFLAETILPSCKTDSPCSTVYKVEYIQQNYYWDFHCYAYAIQSDGAFTANVTSMQIYSNHGNNVYNIQYVVYSYVPRDLRLAPRAAKLSFVINKLAGIAPSLTVSPTDYAMTLQSFSRPNYYIYREFPHMQSAYGPNGCAMNPVYQNKYTATVKPVEGLNTIDVTDILAGYLNSRNGTALSSWNFVLLLPYNMPSNSLFGNLVSPTLTYTQ